MEAGISATGSEAPALQAPMIEGRSIDYVPASARHGKLWQQWPFWFCGNFQYISVAIGLIGPSLGLSLGPSILAMSLGIIVGTVAMAFHGSQGPVFGLPQMIQSRAQFGYRGMVLVLVGTFVTFVGGAILTVVTTATGLNGVFGWNRATVSVALMAVGAVLAVFGHDWVHRAFRILLYCSIPFFLILTIGIGLGDVGGHAPSPGHFTWAAFMSVFAVGLAYNVTYAPYVSDYTRYLPKNTSSRALITAIFFGGSGSAIWLAALGSWMGTRLGTQNALVGMQQAGDRVVASSGTILVILSGFAAAALIALAMYSGMLTVISAADSVRQVHPTRRLRVTWVAVLGVVALGVSLALPNSYLTSLSNFYTIALYLLVPWTAINLTDYFLVRRGQYAILNLFKKDGIYGEYAWRGLTAYILGFACMVPFFVLTFFHGPAATAIDGVDISPLVGAVISALLYFAFTRNLDRQGERAAIDAEANAIAELDLQHNAG